MDDNQNKEVSVQSKLNKYLQKAEGLYKSSNQITHGWVAVFFRAWKRFGRRLHHYAAQVPLRPGSGLSRGRFDRYHWFSNGFAHFIEVDLHHRLVMGGFEYVQFCVFWYQSCLESKENPRIYKRAFARSVRCDWGCHFSGGIANNFFLHKANCRLVPMAGQSAVHYWVTLAHPDIPDLFIIQVWPGYCGRKKVRSDQCDSCDHRNRYHHPRVHMVP